MLSVIRQTFSCGVPSNLVSSSALRNSCVRKIVETKSMNAFIVVSQPYLPSQEAVAAVVVVITIFGIIIVTFCSCVQQSGPLSFGSLTAPSNITQSSFQGCKRAW